MQDANVILRAYLLTQTTLGALIGYTAPVINPPSPELQLVSTFPESRMSACCPASRLFRRGGPSTPYITANADTELSN